LLFWRVAISGSVLICGNEPGKGTRFYVQEISGGASRPVTPEGTHGGLLSPDGRLVLARGSEGKYSLFPIAGGEPQPVPRLAEADIVAHWNADGLLASRSRELSFESRAMIAGGSRFRLKSIYKTGGEWQTFESPYD
jgi:hypothetical protein